MQTRINWWHKWAILEVPNGKMLVLLFRCLIILLDFQQKSSFAETFLSKIFFAKVFQLNNLKMVVRYSLPKNLKLALGINTLLATV